MLALYFIHFRSFQPVVAGPLGNPEAVASISSFFMALKPITLYGGIACLVLGVLLGAAGGSNEADEKDEGAPHDGQPRRSEPSVVTPYGAARRLHEAGRHAEAVAAFDELLSSTPPAELPTLLCFHRGKALIELGRRDEALESLELFLRHFADSPGYRKETKNAGELVSQLKGERAN